MVQCSNADCENRHFIQATTDGHTLANKDMSRTGVPTRTPPGVKALVSPTTEFLLRVIEAISHTFSIFDPVKPSGRKSHRMQ